MLNTNTIKNLVKKNWALSIALCVIIFSSSTVLFYAQQPILEAHGFRQTQTALTSFWMIQEGWKLAYQTPVVGYPWSVPFEFPIYQSLVAFVSWLGNFPLDATGRLISFFFLIICAWPIFNITKRLNLSPNVAWVFCALLWSSPIYLFWGRAFMIETTALFFMMAAVPYAIDVCKNSPTNKSFMLFVFWATLGILQKATTVAPMMFIMGIVVVISHIKINGFVTPSIRKLFCFLISFLMPIIIGLAWTYYTDVIKEQNTFGAMLTSKALAAWNFGSLEQRYDIKVLMTIASRLLKDIGIFGFFLILLAFIAPRQKNKIYIAVSLALCAFPIFLFINLHYIHDYYQSSCAVFLIAAVSFAIFSMEDYKNKLLSPPILTTLLVSVNILFFSHGYGKDIKKEINEKNNTIIKLGHIIDTYAPKDSGIVIFGLDWSSELAYYSKRKSFTVPNSFSQYNDVWNNPENFIGDKTLGALVFCDPSGSPDLKKILENSQVKDKAHLFKIDYCYVWIPTAPLLSTSVSRQKETIDINNVDETINSRFPIVYQGSCIGSLDTINGLTPNAKNPIIKDLLIIRAWMIISGADGTTPDNVFITLRAPNNKTQYIPTFRTPRIDVKTYLQNTSMPDVGFESSLPTKNLHGEYLLGLANEYQGKLTQCNEYNIPITINSVD